jgi:hypothetical protein
MRRNQPPLNEDDMTDQERLKKITDRRDAIIAKAHDDANREAAAVSEAAVREVAAAKELEEFIGSELWQLSRDGAGRMAKRAGSDPESYAAELQDIRDKAGRFGGARFAHYRAAPVVTPRAAQPQGEQPQQPAGGDWLMRGPSDVEPALAEELRKRERDTALSSAAHAIISS